MESHRQRNPIIRFLSFIWSMIKAYLMAIGLLATLLPILIFYMAFHMADGRISRQSKIPDSEKVTITMSLEGTIREHQIDMTDELFNRLFGNSLGVDLSDVHTTLKRAAEDARVQGVFVELKGLDGSLASFSSLRRLFEQYRVSKKPLYIHIHHADNKLYYLASVASHLTLTPVGEMIIPGPVFNLVYMGSALKKLGVTMEVVRAGRYKSAMEPLVEDQPTADTMEMYRSMEESLRQEMAVKIGQDRGKDEATVRGELKHSIFTAPQALQAKLVDELVYLEDANGRFEADMKGAKPYDMYEYLDGSENLDQVRMAKGHSEQLALIEAVGEIQMDGPADGEFILPEPLIEELQWARDNDEIKAVVLRVVSPGGSALASDMIWSAVKSLAAKKPLVVAMGGVAASGGYYIAAPAHKIIAEPTTITGSIGVIGALPKGQAFAEKYGVSFHTVTQSDRAGLLNFGGKMSEQDRTIVGEGIEQFYKTFIGKVAEGRKMSVEQVDQLAQGRVYTGQEALQLKLVDQLGSVVDAFREAKILANLNPDRIYPLGHYEGRRKSLAECLKNPLTFADCMNESGTRIGAMVQHRALSAFRALPEPLQRAQSSLQRLWQHDRLFMVWDGYWAAELN